MANTHTELTVQAVFAVKNRQNVITKDWRDELHRYIAGILTKDGMKSLAVGGWLDHVHILFGIPPTRNLSDVVRVVKTNSSKWVNERRFVQGIFQWQEGYGGFTYSVSQRDAVIKYIMNQEQHHGSQSFRDEYMGLLKNFEVEADSRYLFEFYE